jgi:hypothetical protein
MHAITVVVAVGVTVGGMAGVAVGVVVGAKVVGEAVVVVRVERRPKMFESRAGGEAIVNMDSIVDAFPWKHKLPDKQL